METQPNVFLAPKPRHQGAPPTLGQIKQAFPLPGRYHFRFKSPITPGGDREKHSLSVWMDCVDDRQPVPTWQSTIVAKVTRIGIDEDDDFEDEEEFRRQNITAPAPQQPSPAVTQSAPPATHAPSLDIFDGPTAAPPASNGHHHHHAPPAPQRTAAPATSGGDLLGDFGSSNGHHSAAGAGANDFLGMTAPAATQTASAPPQQQQTRPPPRHSSSGTNNSFDKFSQNNGPFGDLNAW